MDDICIDVIGVPVEAMLERTKHGMELFRRSITARIDAITGCLERWQIEALLTYVFAVATNLDFHQLRKFPAEVVDVNTGATVDARWILVG